MTTLRPWNMSNVAAASRSSTSPGWLSTVSTARSMPVDMSTIPAATQSGTFCRSSFTVLVMI
ncbi:hypothetical protein [Phytohabitans rumicis]|uniref:hypothetical protein n=1 Tax=Phytohabitans rumicis TaxID=1076125 RepID=UPI001C49A379|nr:hypothetical protein [Phytohabitans rumicis]